ncbi:TetR/AcrR family transcriptional regulator [Geobacter sp. AOG2]|uniref:TetR/AcrR family transcriptional regulator n=1 Tax=Geobacter sp. AOG2 TaxID=1566347 RepID=UPI001CC52020|nr:TetR/AcrR family transcriptional regulator [Geobacter sp. AOG2]GFE59623.1 TetR family transcriptional regulator [Geobacter sp. AOG2]
MTISVKREEIVRVALELIAEKGFHGAPIALIANKADVSVGTIYNYFESKDDLINVLFREIYDKIVIFLRHGYSSQKPIKQRYLHLAKALLCYFTTHPLDFRYMEQFYNSPYGVAYRRNQLAENTYYNNICNKLLLEGIKFNVLIDLPIQVLINLAFGPIITLTRDHILGFIELDDNIINICINSCWKSITL